MKKKVLLILFFLNCIILPAQEINIVDYLKRIEAGEIDKVRSEIASLKSQNRNDPSVKFLDAVVTIDGDKALRKYEDVFNNHPNSRYADASLYRIFSYYYALGIYNKAESFLGKLKSDYPNSPYIKAADRKIPDDEEVVAVRKDRPVVKTKDKVTSKNEYNFTVQAGAFLNFQNAEKLKKSFIAAGYVSEINPKSVGGSILNVVTVGRFNNETEAQPLLNYLKENHKLSGRVILL